MATSRQFTYATTTPPSGTTKTGRLWVGTPNTPARSAFNSGGKIWWMGPDEDNRYIIGKDVPTSDWPAKGNTPPYPHDSGSVRFWDTTAKDEAAFVARVNTLPARLGQIPFDDGTQCATWLADNGYWTNWESPIPGQYFATFRLHNGPGSGNYSEPYLDYSPSEDKMVGWNEDMSNTRSNGVWDGISNISQNDLYIVSESSQYLPSSANSGTGMMCFDGSNGYLNTGTHLVKYNMSTNTATSKVSTVHGAASSQKRRPIFEPSTDKVFIPFGQYVDVFDTATLAYSDSINMAVPSGGGNNSAGIGLVNTDDDEVLFADSSGFTIFNPDTLAVIATGTISGGGSLTNGRYNPSTGKYYIGGNGSNGKPKIVVIDASNNTSTTITIAESGGANNNTSTSIALDTVRNFIWCMNDDRKIASLDCSDNSLTHYNTTFAGTNFAVMPYVLNDKLFIGTQVDNNSGKVYKLTTVINNG